MSVFTGDSEYPIDATGDCVVGDCVRFSRALFDGSFRRPKFVGFEVVTGTIVKESYGKLKQQHTFTLDVDGIKTLIKGRNLYRNGVYRKPWQDEQKRSLALEEKHTRGAQARQARYSRKLRSSFNDEFLGGEYGYA